jgi:cytochrome P450
LTDNIAQKTHDSFALSDLANCPDPYPLFEAARTAHGPVFLAGNTWLILGRAEGFEFLRNPNTRSGFISELYQSMLPPGAARDEMAHRINFLDPPHHWRVRKIAQKTLTPPRLDALRPFVQNLCRDRLAELKKQGGEIDLIANYAHEIPALVISELLGVPPEDRDKLTHLTEKVANLLGLQSRAAEQMQEAIEAAETMHAYLRDLADKRRAEPKDDLLSALVHAEEDGERLSDPELFSLAATLYSAGHRTTRDSFSNGLAVLLQHGEVLADFKAGKLPTDALVDEFLRFETPTHYVVRILTEPMELGGVTLPANTAVAAVLAAANRDPSAYGDADSFRPARWLERPAPPAPFSFASGPHLCLGARLAKLEVATLIDMLFECAPDVALTNTDLQWEHTGLFRSLASLPVTLD